MTVPLIQGGMGVGISMGGLAGAVAREGGMGVISTANIGFREDDFRSDTTEADKRALRREIEKAREISEGNGLIAVNVMNSLRRLPSDMRYRIQNAISMWCLARRGGLKLNMHCPIRWDSAVTMRRCCSGGFEHVVLVAQGHLFFRYDLNALLGALGFAGERAFIGFH